MKNPLLSRGSIPDFNSIKPEHFLPALDTAMEAVRKKLQEIKSDTAEASFQNTVVPLESLFQEVSDIQRLLGNYANNAFSKKISAIEEKVNLRVSALEKEVFQDSALGTRFRDVYDRRTTLVLNADDNAILKNLHHSFEASGALLPTDGQNRIRTIDEELIRLSQQFKNTMKQAPAQQAVLITDASELAGLSAEEIGSFAENARKNGHKTGWLVTPERLLVDELLERAENAALRKKIFTALNNMGKVPPHDTRPIIAGMQKLRDEFAKLLGYDHYAAFARSRAMMTDLPAVRQLLTDVAAKALPKFEADMRALEKFSAANGGPVRLEPWDVSYWAMQQRDALYKFDANGFAKYLELEHVMDGMFNEAQHLFGIEFREMKNPSVLHPDIRAYEVFDSKTGKEIGILHVDMFSRPESKIGGAWMNQVQKKDGDQRNIIILNMNITKPPEGKPALIGLSQYITLYHEMGHSLQGLLGTDVKYNSLQGTAAPADFVEFHSMVNERRAVLKKNLQAYALHVDTGKPAPDSMIDALIKSKAHFEARDMLKLVQNSLRDLEFHSLDPAAYQGDDALEQSVKLDSPYADHIRPYPLTRFGHLFDEPHSGYAAGYVNYLIAQEHAADGFAPFESDPYNLAWAQRLSDLYHRGSGGDPFTLYHDYRGQDATPEAMLRDAGITEDAPKPAAEKKVPPKDRKFK